MPQDYSQMSVSDFFAAEDAAEAKEKGGDKVAELEAKIAELTGRIQGLTTTVASEEMEPWEYPEAPDLVELSFEGLPDMYSEPDKYQQALARRIQENNLVNQRIQREYEREIAAVDAVQANRAQALWSEFTEKHPELKEYEDQVRFVAEKVALEKRSAGVDPQAYIFRSKDQFFDEVVKGVRKFVPALAAGATGGEGEGVTVEDDAVRTAGTFGGAFSAFAPGAKEAGGGAPKGDMVKDMHTIQRKGGFF